MAKKKDGKTLNYDDLRPGRPVAAIPRLAGVQGMDDRVIELQSCVSEPDY